MRWQTSGVPLEKPDCERPPCILVEAIMTTALITAHPDTELSKIMQVLRDHNIRHMPVIDRQGILCGIISNRDMLVAHVNAKNVEGERLATHIMSRELVTVRPETCAGLAAREMYDSKLGSLPVVDENMRLVGLITEADFVEMFASHAPCRCGQAKDQK